MQTPATRTSMLEQLVQDTRYALRSLRRSPLFTTVAVLCLTFGVATNSAMFSVFNALVLRPLPFPEPDQLVSLFERDPPTGDRASLSYLDYLDWRKSARSFSDIGAHSGRLLAITEGEEPERVPGRLISASLFPLLGVPAQLGRLVQSQDDQPGAPPVTLISDALWRRRYGGDSAVVGRTISLNSLPYVVVGVMPPRFQFPSMTELWLPIGPALAAVPRDVRGVTTIGRLRPDVRLAEASGEIAAIARGLHEQYPSSRAGQRNRAWTGEARALRRSFVGGDERIITVAMLGATTFLLLIACANVANLMLTRAVTRQREIAVRAAIGASRWRIAAPLLLESVLLALTACLVALPLTALALRWIRAAVPPSDPFPYFVHWSLDLPTFLYAAAASLGTGALFGLGPALLASRGRLQDALKTGSPGVGTGPRHHRLRNALVVTEVALALVLLVGASLFVRTFLGLRRTELGYDPARVMTMRVYLPGTRYDSARARTLLVEDMLRRVEGLPDVSAATVSDLIPLDDEGGSQGAVVIEGSAAEPGRTPSVAYAGVAGRWFETFGITLTAGRTFADRELRDSVPVAVINQAMAARFWPGASPLGRRFRLAADSAHTWYEVIGVAPDIRTVKLDEDMRTPPTAYLPFRFISTRDYGVMIRTRLAPAAITGRVRSAIHAADPVVPIFNAWTMEEVRHLSFWMYAMWGTMFAVFGAIALVLAAIGVYGVIHYSVAQRTHEIGVRVALGAQRPHIVRLVLGQGVALAGAGVALGLAGAFALTRVVESLLIGVSPTDPVSFGGVALFLTGIACLASYLPARRATKVDPLVALRQE